MLPKLSEKKNRTITVLLDYLVITFGILLYVGAWAIFLLPNNLLGGGVSGLCAILYYATGIPMGVMNFVINAVLLVIAFIILGHGFGIKTIYAIILSSIGLTFLPGLIPQQFVSTFSVENGKMLCTIIGGIMTGLGIGLTFTHGGSTGGTDIVALVINKYRSTPPGRLLFCIDMVIIFSSLVVPSYTSSGEAVPFVQKVANAIYALVMVGVNSYAVDLYLTGTKQSVQLFIFTKKKETVADAIAFDLDRGVTMLRSRGWFHKEESEVLMVVARKTDLNTILRCIKSIDPKAFVTVSSAMGVYGQGFDVIKDRSGKTDKNSEKVE